MLFPDNETSPAGRSRLWLLALAAMVGLIGGAWWLWPHASPSPSPTAARRPAPTAPEAGAPARPAASDARPERAPTSRPARKAETPEPAPAAPAAEVPVSRGVLRVQSDVDGASVFLDRTFLGTTPLEKTGLAPGSHRVNVSADGYEGIAQTVDIGDTPAELTVKFKEVRLDASTAVVHKHGVGSCAGRLIATVQGLRYDTSNRGDAFDVPFTRVQALEVDYLQKNLRVKLAGGKTYNFTEPSGNADALFVFHRDVEKARAKLSGR
jgi:hypothetical protein